jgi:hypothetical protein
VSDFLSRLVARSSGEKPAVRPRVAPAFAQQHAIAEQLPAGEVLRGAPEVQRAIAPLPVQHSHRMSPNRRGPEKTSDVPRPAERRESSLSGFYHADAPSALEIRPSGVVETQATLFPTSHEEAAMSAQSPVARPTVWLEERPHGDRTIKRTQAEHGPATVFQTVAVTREVKDVVRAISKPNEAVLVPPNFPVVRPSISKSELPLEACKKKPTNEPPTIQVTIGKIEVRASIAGPKSGEKKKPTGVMSLEEYQRLRSRRSAG